tara:strand:- start:288 stop:758 length:471 start_codon:yes stop_codon:yes gene_type:complete
MNNFINPIDLIILVIILTIAIAGFNNRLIIESKKNIALISSIFFTSLIINYATIINLQSAKLFIFIIIFIILLFLISFICDLIITGLPILSIDKNQDRALGGLLGLFKGLIIISILIFILDIAPVQKNIKNKIYHKSKQDSILFDICDKIKEIIIY